MGRRKREEISGGRQMAVALLLLLRIRMVDGLTRSEMDRKNKQEREFLSGDGFSLVKILAGGAQRGLHLFQEM